MIKKILLLSIIILLAFGCRNNAELNMERGEYYYSVGEYENALLEYKKVVNLYSNDATRLNHKTIQIVANAHHNLAVIYFRRGHESEDGVEKSLYMEKAEVEAKKSYDLYPKDTYKKTWDNIKKELEG